MFEISAFVQNPTMTAKQFAEMLKELKPYFFKLEEMCSELEHGDLTITLSVRNKMVEKMAIHSEKTWLRPKAGHDPRLTS